MGRANKRYDAEDASAKRRKNAEAQAAFRQRRATYIDHLEGTVQELHDICIQLNSLFVSSHQESVELSAKWSAAQNYVVDLQSRIPNGGAPNSASTSTSHHPSVFSPQSSHSFSPASVNSSPPTYDMANDPALVFLKGSEGGEKHFASHHQHGQQQQPQPPHQSQHMNAPGLPGDQVSATGSTPCPTPASWMSDLSMSSVKPPQTLPDHLPVPLMTSSSEHQGTPSASGTPMPLLAQPLPDHSGAQGYYFQGDWDVHHQHPASSGLMCPGQPQQKPTPQHPLLHPGGALMSSASSSAISPAATFAEAPAQQPLAFAAVGATTRQSHRFHPYEDPAESELFNPCSTGNNVARADSLGMRWSRCDEALQGGREALREARDMKIQRAQAQKHYGADRV